MGEYFDEEEQASAVFIDINGSGCAPRETTPLQGIMESAGDHFDRPLGCQAKN
jgi:hypothetical protein